MTNGIKITLNGIKVKGSYAMKNPVGIKLRKNKNQDNNSINNIYEYVHHSAASIFLFRIIILGAIIMLILTICYTKLSMKFMSTHFLTSYFITYLLTYTSALHPLKGLGHPLVMFLYLESIYLYFPPSSQLLYLCFCPVGLSLL